MSADQDYGRNRQNISCIWHKNMYWCFYTSKSACLSAKKSLIPQLTILHIEWLKSMLILKWCGCQKIVFPPAGKKSYIKIYKIDNHTYLLYSKLTFGACHFTHLKFIFTKVLLVMNNFSCRRKYYILYVRKFICADQPFSLLACSHCCEKRWERYFCRKL
jgi:hypothetical protein